MPWMDATVNTQLSIYLNGFDGLNNPGSLAPDVYAGLSTSSIAADKTGHAEPSASNGYARVLLRTAVDTTIFTITPGNPTQAVLIGNIVFPRATASWGTITTVFLSTFSVVGNTTGTFVSADLTSSRLVASGESLVIDSGDLTFTCD